MAPDDNRGRGHLARGSAVAAPVTGGTQQLHVAGRLLNVWSAGAGEDALLLVHGIPTSHWLWRDVAPRLARRARVVAPDLLGYGRSARPAGLAVDIAAQAAYLVELLDVLEIERATVVGHDIGGGVAQILAVRYGDRVARLGLVNAVCYDAWPVFPARVLQLGAPVFRQLPAPLLMLGLNIGLRLGFVQRERAAGFLALFLAPFTTRAGLQVFFQHVEALSSRFTEELAPRLPLIRIPAAVIWGRQDPFLKPRYARRLAADIPTAELAMIEQAGHFAPADAPEAVTAAIERLLGRALAPPRF